ncbi:MAG: DUF167 family protein [Desulfurivibrionaceae bacterium]|nr:DUF167 family protein [Desulfobulbales bacterium]MDT8334620.1 DUF167 family protein [Desulfurivibrionaceae bacterium]
MPYLTTTEKNRLILDLYVQPKSSRTKVAGLHDGAIKLMITAPPVDGKANTQVTTFIAKILGLAKSAVTLQSGHQSRRKRIALTGIEPDEVRRILAPLL